MKNLIFPFYLIFLLKVNFLTFAEEKKQILSKVLLLTENSLSNDFKNYDKRFSNTLSARLADVKMGVITPEAIISGINSNKQKRELSTYKDLTQNNKITLARQLGADAILSVNVDSFTNSKAVIPKFDRTVLTFRLVANYKLISASENSAFGGDSIIVEKKIPLTSKVGLSASEDTIFSELSDQAAEMISQSIFNSALLETEIASKFKDSSSGKFTSPLGRFPTDQKLVSVNISANLKEMTMPEIIAGEDGQLSLSGNVLKVIPGDAEIIINGLTVGMSSNDQKIKVPEGICRMQIKRTGFVVEEKLINAYEGLRLSFVLEPTQEEYSRWKEQIRFLQEIKTAETFNKNQIKLTEGIFEYLKNSKYEVPEINLNKSLFQ